MASRVSSLSLSDTWVLHGPSTFQGTFSHSVCRSHTHSLRHLSLQVWMHQTMCRQCTRAHKLCFAIPAAATMLENYFWTSNRLSPDTRVQPLPPCHLACPSTFLARPPFFALLFSLFSFPLLSKKSLNTKGNYFDKADMGRELFPLLSCFLSLFFLWKC